MNYHLTVKERIPNPDYDAQVKEYESRRGYGWNGERQYPTAYTERDVLIVLLTDKEFRAVKTAIVGAIE